MNSEVRTHYRKAFNSPYLSSSDIVCPTVLTVARVALEPDHTKKTKDFFNTAHFAEREIRQGEPLKPMILNAHNSRIMRQLTGSHFLEEWVNVPVTIYVDPSVKFGRDTVEGLRISPEPPRRQKPQLTPDKKEAWTRAIESYKAVGDLSKVLAKMDISDENQQLIIEAAANA